MSSEIPESKSEARAESNRRKRKNLLDDFASIDSQSPPKRILRSSTVTPIKSGPSEVHLPLKGVRLKFTPRKPPISLSPKKTGTHSIEFPHQLMPQKEIPATEKINSYSKADYFVHIAGVLRGTDYLDALLASPLGSLFKLPASKVSLSGKLTHNILCRMLPTRKRHEVWFVFANRPIRLSLKEFASVTGLPCGQYPKDPFFAECTKVAETVDDPNSFWNELMVGCIKSGQLKDIANLLWDDPDSKLKEEELRVFRKERAKLSRKKKMRLCLVLLVDGVLCPKSSAKMASKSTVEFVRDISMFLKYPWGRESFELTIECVKTASQSANSIQGTIKKLKKQTHYLLKGLSIAFQLLFFSAVPALGQIAVEDSEDERLTVAHKDLKDLESNLRFNNSDILEIDNDPNTLVFSLVQGEYRVDGIDFTWPDEVSDAAVDNMVICIEEGYNFKNAIWSKEEDEISTQLDTKKARRGGKRKPPKPQAVKRSKTRSSPTHILDDDDSWKYNPEDYIDRYLYETLRPQTELELVDAKDFIEKKFWRNLKALSTKCKADNFLEVEVTTDNEPNKQLSSDSESESNTMASKRSTKVKAKGKSTVHEYGLVDEDTESDDEWLKSTRLGSSGIQSFGTAPIFSRGEKAVESSTGNSLQKKEVTKTTNISMNEAMPVEITSADQNAVQHKNLHEKKEDVSRPFKADSEEKRGHESEVNVENPQELVESITQQIDVVVDHTSKKEHKKDADCQLPVKYGSDEMGENPSADCVKTVEDIQETLQNPLDKSGQLSKRVTEPDLMGEHKKIKESGIHQTAATKSDLAALMEEDDDDKDMPCAETVDMFNEGWEVSDRYVTKKQRNDVVDQNLEDADWTGIEFLKVPTDSAKVAVGDHHIIPDTHMVRPPDASYGFTRPSQDKINALFKKVDNYKSPEYLIYNITVPKGIFRELASPTVHVSTNHMELMLGAVWDQLGEDLSANRTVILGTGLCSFILRDAARYKEKNGDPFVWDMNLVKMVNGTFFQREGATAWLVNVDRVYAPMNWLDKHWVGLCIELVTGWVYVFDSFADLVSKPKADELMAPILETLPLMISDLTAGSGATYTPPAVFGYSRLHDAPQNKRGGDCGPLAVKFMELHAQGKPFPVITEKMVDDMRMHYAVDIFERFMYALD